jgi:mono/diheme cytochrome c family protein
LKVGFLPLLRSGHMKRCLLALLLMVAACSEPIDSDATGEAIFVANCAACHGSGLAGGVGPALGPGSHAAEQSDEYLVTTITNGRGSRMPSFRATLTEQQILDVVSYIRQVQSC